LGDRRFNPDELEKDIQRYVRKIAFLFWSRNQDIDYREFISEGYVGSTIAAKKYDPSRGVPFLYYAVHWIEAKIRDHIRKHRRHPCGITRKSEERHLEIYLYDETDSDAEDNPMLLAPAEQRLATSSYDETEDRLIAHEDAKWVTRRVLCLPRREQIIIVGRFYEERTLDSIAMELCLSKERIRQIEARALRIMREMEDEDMKLLSEKAVTDTVTALAKSGSIAKAAEILGINQSVIRYRISSNERIAEAATTYAGYKRRKKKDQVKTGSLAGITDETGNELSGESVYTEDAHLTEKPEQEKGGTLDGKPLSFKGTPTPAEGISLSEEEFRKFGGGPLIPQAPMIKITIEIMCPAEKLPEIMKVVNNQ